MNLKNITWPQVVLLLGLVGMVLGAVVYLASLGQDTAAVFTFGGLVLAGMGVMAGQQSAIKENTNGNTTKMLGMLEKQGELLASMTPAAKDKQPSS